MRAECQTCPLNKKGKTFVPGHGPEKAKYAIIGEAPGSIEVAKKRPFVGPSGQLLRKVLRAIGVDPDEVYMTNVVKCRPPQNRTPKASEIKRCNTVPAELWAHGVEVVIPLGNSALRTLSGITGITKARGKEFAQGDWRVIPTFHPAAVLRNPDYFPSFAEDLEKAFSPVKPHPEPLRVYDVIPAEDIQAACEFFDGLEGLVAYDLETRALNPVRENTILCVSFSRSTGDATVIAGQALYHVSVRSAWREAIKREGVRWLAHNAQFDSAVVNAQLGFRVPVDEDTMLMSYALDERGGIHGLKELCQRKLNVEDWEADVKKYPSFADIPWTILVRYNAQDTANCYRLYEHFLEKLEKAPTVHRMYRGLLCPGAYTLANMTAKGVRINEEFRKEEYQREIVLQGSLKGQLQGLITDPTYNPNSYPQTAVVLYDVLKAPDYRHTIPVAAPDYTPSVTSKDLKARTTCADQLERLTRGPYEVVVKEFAEMLLAYRASHQYARTFLKNYAPESDGCIHPRFLLHGTVTGRLSGTKPNVMNMHRSGSTRKLIIPREGNVLVAADYSQAELRTLAALAKSEPMRAIFERGEDIHEISGRRVFGDSYDLDPDKHRQVAKTVNFGIAYGLGAAGLAFSTGLSAQDAQTVIDDIKELFQVSDWMKGIFAQALRNQFVETPTGRRRRFHLITRDNVQDIFRQAINAPVQGTASDLMLMALIEVDSWIQDLHGYILYPTHDEILLGVREDCAEEAGGLLVETMLAQPVKLFEEFPVPFVVDAAWGMTASKEDLRPLEV